MATAHIESLKEDIANVVLMPGDPLRAKFIAENFLTDAKLVNSVRNILAYTGLYKGKRVTVFASGMGNPSMGIYSYELYKYYDVDTIIRIGSVGSYKEEVNLFDLVITENSVSDSSFGKVFSGYSDEIITGNTELNVKIENVAAGLNKTIHKGNIYCGDVFYEENGVSELVKKYDCVGVEMESFALFLVAKKLNKKAACLLTVSNSFVTNEETTSEEREKGFSDMVQVALESVI